MTGRLAGKVAFVTGAARGLGRACALRLAEEGADLILVDIGVVSRLLTVPHELATADELERTAKEARGLDRRVVSRFVDVRDGDALSAAVQAGVQALGSVDVAVPAAGVQSQASAWEMSETQWRTMIDVNLTGVWQTAKAVAPLMIEQRSGSIVFIGSALAHHPELGYAHAAAAKHGVFGLVRSFALELAPYHVRANSVDPSPLGTATISRRAPHQLQPIDVANAVLFLASEEARGITGTSLVVDMGASLAR